MCGICGLAAVDSRRPGDGALLRAMADIIRHRGPDGEGFFTAPGIGLGIRRLAIIDLETGEQPIANEDGRVVLVCNGEIYNYVELRQELIAAGHRFHTRSDVEVIVHLYEDCGPECIHRLRGMFAFALWDGGRRRLMLARDRLGIKPLHYAATAEGLVFGSELKSILLDSRVERQLDLAALQDMFTLGYVRAPKTLFTRIRRLLPGHYLLYHEGCLSVSRYWDVCFPQRGEAAPGLREGEWAEALLAKLEESVRLHMRSDVPVGSLLSAGLDSSTVAGLMGRFTEEPIHTFSLAFEEPSLDEISRQATLNRFPGYGLTGHRATCGHDGLSLLPEVLWHREDPSTAGVEIPYKIVSQAAAHEVKVALTGEGADELFGGYAWYRRDKLLRPLAHLPLGLRRLMLLAPPIPSLWPSASEALVGPPQMGLDRFRRLVGPPRAKALPRLLAADLRAQLGDTSEPEGDLVRPAGFPSWHPFVQLQYYDLKVRLPDLILHMVDRMSMAHSLEVRVPFLDHELVELCSRIPPGLKLRGLQEKHILRRAVRDVLPREIARRRKRGLMAPSAQWLRGDLPEFAADLLSAEALRRKGYFDSEAVQRLLARHRSGQGDFRSQLLGVLAVQLWDDLFLRGTGFRQEP